MVNDQNKTRLTRQLTSAAAMWLDGSGFKPVETEVPIQGGKWIADLAGVILPTQTELIGLKLIKRMPPHNPHCIGDPDNPEFWLPSEAQEQWTRELRSLQRLMTCIVEIKTTRADMRGDWKWKEAVPADLAFLACPRGLLKPDEWPEGWGILEYADNKVTRRRAPVPLQATIEQQLEIILAVSLRRDSHTRYARMREFTRKIRQEKNGREVLARIDRITRALTSIVYGEHQSVEGALKAHGVKIGKLQRGTAVERLEQLWNFKNRSAMNEEERFEFWWKAVGGYQTLDQWQAGYHQRREAAKTAYLAGLREAASGNAPPAKAGTSRSKGEERGGKGRGGG